MRGKFSTIGSIIKTSSKTRSNVRCDDKLKHKRKELIRLYMESEDYNIKDENELVKTIAHITVFIPATNNFVVMQFNKLEHSVTYDSRFPIKRGLL